MAERTIDFLGSMAEEKKRGRPVLERLPPTAFVYDRDRDCFVCSEGKLLGYEGSHTKKKGFNITATKRSGGTAKAARGSRSVARRIRSKAVRWFAAKRGRACLSSEDGQRRSASTVPPPWEGGGVLPRMDQEHVGPAAVSRARVGEGANGNAVGLPRLQLAALDPLEKPIQRPGKLEQEVKRQILSDPSKQSKKSRSDSFKEKRHGFLHGFTRRVGHPATKLRRQAPPQNVRLPGYAAAVAAEPLQKASRSALIWSAFVVGMPCGKPG